MIQSHHFPFSFCWHELTVGGGGLKKQKLHKDLSVWTKKGLLQMHCRQPPSGTLWSPVSFLQTRRRPRHSPTGGEDAGIQTPWRTKGSWKPWNQSDLGSSSSLTNLPAGGFAYIIRSEPWFPHELSEENVPTSQGGWDKSRRAISTPSMSAVFSG